MARVVVDVGQLEGRGIGIEPLHRPLRGTPVRSLVSAPVVAPDRFEINLDIRSSTSKTQVSATNRYSMDLHTVQLIIELRHVSQHIFDEQIDEPNQLLPGKIGVQDLLLTVFSPGMTIVRWELRVTNLRNWHSLHPFHCPIPPAREERSHPKMGQFAVFSKIVST